VLATLILLDSAAVSIRLCTHDRRLGFTAVVCYTAQNALL
jgi:hypothetical protein